MISIVFHFSLKDKGIGGKRVKGRILVQTAGHHQYLSFDLLVQIHLLGLISYFIYWILVLDSWQEFILIHEDQIPTSEISEKYSQVK